MFPVNREELQNLQLDDCKKLQKLDDYGCFAGAGESLEDFKCRLIKELDSLNTFRDNINNSDSIVVFDDIKVAKGDLVPNDIVREGMKKAAKLYDFEIDYLPAFFLNQDIGLLWGGCSVYDESTSQRFILIRKNFKKKRRWFIYDRRELLAHELCHGARQVLNDSSIEEFFAYQTSESAFRRYMGNCFIAEIDAILFVLPALLLLAAQLVKMYLVANLWIWPFWVLTLGVFLFFGIRNHLARRRVFGAIEKLESWNIKKPQALLFRCTSAEISEINNLKKREEFLNWIRQKGENEIRFQVIKYKWKFDG